MSESSSLEGTNTTRSGQEVHPVSTGASAETGTGKDTPPWIEVETAAKLLLDSLDKQNAGKVTEQQLAGALVDPHYRGQQAEVLAGLYAKFPEVAQLSGGDGQAVSDSGLHSLARTIYDSEVKASTLIQLDSWTSSHFQQLDRDSKGFLRHEDVLGALARSSGTDQKMLQMLDSQFGQFTQNGQLKASDVSQYVDNYLVSDPKFALTDYFERIIARTRQAENSPVAHQLFANDQAPERSVNAASIKQGFRNDCSLNAPLAALAQLRPQEVATMITRNQSGAYDVRFPGADRTVTVAAPTDAELGILDSAEGSGFWPAILEKAYGQLKIDRDQRLNNGHLIPEDVINTRAPLKEATQLITGHKAEEKFLLYTGKEGLYDILQESLNGPKPRVVTLGTGSALASGTTKDGFELNHGFSVLGFQPDGNGDGRVLVRDSYGVGGPNNDGLRTISLEQLKDNFTDIVYEQ